jgi:hypothetical protein
MHSPRLAAWGDRLCLALLVLTLWVEFVGGIRFGDDWYQVRVTSVWRVAMYTAALVILRHLIVPHPSLRERLSARRRARSAAAWPGERVWLPPRREWLWAGTLFVVATAWALREQLRNITGVADLGDPLFSMWRLATIADRLAHDPLNLFNGSMFYPTPNTLALSDAILLPGLLAAPFLWLGVPVAVVYGAMYIGTFLAAGLAMFLLVRAMTRQFMPALLAGVLFAFYPYRFSSYSHLEKLGTFFMPIAFLLLWRVLQVGRRSEGLALGATLAAQALWSLYLAAFLSVSLAAVTVARWAAGHFTWRERGKSLIAAVAVFGLIGGIYTVPYWRARATVGERARFEVLAYSSSRSDLLTITPRNQLWSPVLTEGENGERHLFPGATAIVLSAAALVPPVSPLAASVAIGLAVSVDGALGLNGSSFAWLYDTLPPFRAFRAPGRFSTVVGLFVCLLAGLGMARWLGPNPGKVRQVAAACVVAFAFFELQVTLNLQAAPTTAPAIYSALPDAGEAVLVDLPIPDRFNALDFQYIYNETFHRRRILNGSSGFIPEDYSDLVEASREFPSARALDILRQRGAQYAVLHADYYSREDYARIVTELDARSGVTLVAARPSPQGAEDRLYRLR